MKTVSLLVLVLSVVAPAYGLSLDETPSEGGLANVSPRFHVALSYPQGGEVFSAGVMIQIQWEQVQAHLGTNWDVFYSTDGGQVFRAIEYDLPAETRSYAWLVPNVATADAQVRIIQDNDMVDYMATSPNFTIQAVGTSTDDAGEVPGAISLQPVFPNPFAESATLGFTLNAPSHVRLEVFDATGRRIAVVADRIYPAGRHDVTWNAEGVPPGSYIARIRTETATSSVPLVHIR